ncbi:DUF3304 domain-containing protein [Aquincola sp. MAHUQ-54]|uniref:DUF3304 domain-containing protein n=1 Tax=Aquincola agrisoli TaxID=3119538 RepID=A0AAW9QCW0_9BURK
MTCATPWAPALAAAVLLCACRPAPPDPDALIGVSITGINYTDEGVQDFFVDGAWGANLPTYGGGGGTTCCVMLPRTWRPGLTVTVKWTIGHYTRPYKLRKHIPVMEQRACCWSERSLEKTVPVQQYAKPAKLQVFFLPDDELEIWVFDATPPNPDHPSGRPYPLDPRPPEEE